MHRFYRVIPSRFFNIFCLNFVGTLQRVYLSGPDAYVARAVEAQIGGGRASWLGALRCVRAREPVVRDRRRRPHHQGSKHAPSSPQDFTFRSIEGTIIYC